MNITEKDLNLLENCYYEVLTRYNNINLNFLFNKIDLDEFIKYDKKNNDELIKYVMFNCISNDYNYKIIYDIINKYYKEANFIVGQHQSMELDRESIEGDWANIGDEEYFVYTKASIMGLCVIGNHEPCFSVSTFFSKNDENYKVFTKRLFHL